MRITYNQARRQATTDCSVTSMRRISLALIILILAGCSFVSYEREPEFARVTIERGASGSEVIEFLAVRNRNNTVVIKQDMFFLPEGEYLFYHRTGGWVVTHARYGARTFRAKLEAGKSYLLRPLTEGQAELVGL